MIKKLGYIFSKADKIKIGILMLLVIAGSFLELLAVSIFSPFIELIMDMDSLEESSVMYYLYHLLDFKQIEHFLAVALLCRHPQYSTTGRKMEGVLLSARNWKAEPLEITRFCCEAYPFSLAQTCWPAT